MSELIFLFNLDATITAGEIFPIISSKMDGNILERMGVLTESTMSGKLPFKQNLLKRIELLKDIPVSEVNQMITDMPLNEKLVDFIRRYRDRCYIVTANLDIWIEGLIKKIGMEKNVFSSKALMMDDRLQNVLSIVDKNAVISQMVMPFAAIGNGNNDAEMIEAAQIGIGYGEICDIAPSVLDCADYAVYKEEKLVEFLEKLI